MTQTKEIADTKALKQGPAWYSRNRKVTPWPGSWDKARDRAEELCRDQILQGHGELSKFSGMLTAEQHVIIRPTTVIIRTS